MDTPPARPAGPRASAYRDRLAKPPQRKKGPLYVAAGGVVALLALLYFLVIAGSKPHHTVEVSALPSEATGDPVPVAYGVKAGDAFETHLETKGAMGLSVQQDAPGGGMTLKVHLTGRHVVAPKEGGGLASSIDVRCDEFMANVPTDDSFVTGQTAFTVRFDRDATGRPIPSSALYAGLEGTRSRLLAILMAGLPDWATNYLPPRPVRVGEAWDLSEAVDPSTVAEIVRFVALMNPKSTKGFPPIETKGRVRVEAHEDHDGEDSLHLKLALACTVEGTVEKPAVPGMISAACKVDGDLWVSTTTGLLLETNLEASLLSTYRYDDPKTSNERKVSEHVHTKTTRVSGN